MRRLIEIATERRVTIVMLMVAIVLFGMVSLSRLKMNLLPDISYPTVTVRTELTGAAPVEVENLLTKPVEEAVGVIRNVRLVRSVSRSGQSDVTLEFLWGTDMDIAGVDVAEVNKVLKEHRNMADMMKNMAGMKMGERMRAVQELQKQAMSNPAGGLRKQKKGRPVLRHSRHRQPILLNQWPVRFRGLFLMT